MRHRLLVLLLFLGLPMLAVGAATPASAQITPTVKVTSATVVARGAALEVTATVTCEEGYSGFLSFQVTQRSGGGIAQGWGDTPIVCTGEPQTVTVLVVAQGGGAPFRTGTALVNIYGAVCTTPDFETCDEIRVTGQTVRISR
jgi:hypothetical protein